MPTVTRISTKRLKGHGFSQGTVADRNAGECCVCEKRIQTVRSWWFGGGGEYDDNWEGYCRKHAEAKVLKDEKMWASYPMPEDHDHALDTGADLQPRT